MENEIEPPHSPAFETLRYLTVQDLLWINLQATKKVQHFNYARLEEAAFYQYGYGSSRNIARQAARFLNGLMKIHPFDAGNDVTAFIGCLAFLRLNGLELNLADASAPAWIEGVRSSQTATGWGIGTIAGGVRAGSGVKEAVDFCFTSYPKTVAALVGEQSRRAAS